MRSFLSFLIIFFVYNNISIAMENKPYHHLSDGTLETLRALQKEMFHLTGVLKFLTKKKENLKWIFLQTMS